jgi:hypothetical protein
MGDDGRSDQSASSDNRKLHDVFLLSGTTCQEDSCPMGVSSDRRCLRKVGGKALALPLISIILAAFFVLVFAHRFSATGVVITLPAIQSLLRNFVLR